MDVSLVEPFYGGSHRAWADGYAAHSMHDVTLVTLPAENWRWRMRGGAVALADQVGALCSTGYRPDDSWLDGPVLDHKGRIRHDGGVAESPGLYVTGLNVLRRRRSSFISGAEGDSEELSAHLHGYLGVLAGDH